MGICNGRLDGVNHSKARQRSGTTKKLTASKASVAAACTNRRMAVHRYLRIKLHARGCRAFNRFTNLSSTAPSWSSQEHNWAAAFKLWNIFYYSRGQAACDADQVPPVTKKDPSGTYGSKSIYIPMCMQVRIIAKYAVLEYA